MPPLNGLNASFAQLRRAVQPFPLCGARALSALSGAPRFLFFSGKGGVGKTSLACAAALRLSDGGRRVLLVGTDPASNLAEMLGAPGPGARDVPGAPRLRVRDIDPGKAAEAYRGRVIQQMPRETPPEEITKVREQLSGACTTEIAAFDEFAGLLADPDPAYECVVFDTAPTGHTLRLLSLPRLWSGFLEGNDRGASCLGPHSGLTTQRDMFSRAVAALADPGRTRIVLVARPDASALAEAERTRGELAALGLANQHLIVNGVFDADPAGDAVAESLRSRQQAAMAAMPASLASLPRDAVPLKPFDMVGLPALRALLDPSGSAGPVAPKALDAGDEAPLPPPLSALVDQLAERDTGLVMVMGKGGVGKTTIAAAIAVALASRGKSVHLTTTDPAAHLEPTLRGTLPHLLVDRIDPRAETQRYVDKILATKGRNLDDEGRKLLLEDLRSPCTEEVAVFHAFSRTVAEARSSFVVLDTAPTGHTLLLIDATGAYHRQTERALPPGTKHYSTPLLRLRDPAHTRTVLVALPETTPVSEAAALQDDLRRAGVEPFAWVVNASLAAAGTRHPLLAGRVAGERVQMRRVGGMAGRCFVVPWRTEPPVGIAALRELAGADGTGSGRG
ncbi:arsenite-activated ATPase ArsA [Hyaloraphidium curvatum]|nr:arsenite-activated ATPase ArsA [Hyaloraphidium curvatum]